MNALNVKEPTLILLIYVFMKSVQQHVQKWPIEDEVESGNQPEAELLGYIRCKYEFPVAFGVITHLL